MLCVSYSHSFLTVQVHFRDVCFIQWQLTYLIVHFTLCVSYSDSTFQGCVLYSDSFLTVIVHFSVVFHTVTVHFNVVFHTVTAFLQWQYISGDVSFTYPQLSWKRAFRRCVFHTVKLSCYNSNFHIVKVILQWQHFPAMHM